MSIVAATAPEAPRLLMLPFALLLIAVAIAPLILRHHWERHYYKVSFALAAFVLAYYLFVRGDLQRVTHALVEYLSFMVVVDSFFVVAGGIHVRARSQCRPLTNTVFLIVGALLANVIGTIGASMLLIRPWIEMNRTRFAGFHLAFLFLATATLAGYCFRSARRYSSVTKTAFPSSGRSFDYGRIGFLLALCCCPFSIFWISSIRKKRSVLIPKCRLKNGAYSASEI